MKTSEILNMSSNELYQYDDHLLFRIKRNGDWSLDETKEDRSVTFVCPKHRIDLVKEDYLSMGKRGFRLACPLCEQEEEYKPLRFHDSDFSVLEKKALAMLDKSNLATAKLIRLNDVYTREIKKFDAYSDKDSDYSIKADVKTDVNGDTIVIIYVGYKGKKDKAQLFIKPEKLQLSHDFKDLDPAKILAKVELTLKDRVITQTYDCTDRKEGS